MSNDHRRKQITLPGLSFKTRQIAYIKALGEMQQSTRVKEQQDNRQSATVMKILNLQDQMEYRLICPALMISAFGDEGDKYIGKCFEVVVSAEKMVGKDYKDCQVYEIDCDRDYTDYPIHQKPTKRESQK